jgi:hypothetical protein
VSSGFGERLGELFRARSTNDATLKPRQTARSCRINAMVSIEDGERSVIPSDDGGRVHSLRIEVLGQSISASFAELPTRRAGDDRVEWHCFDGDGYVEVSGELIRLQLDPHTLSDGPATVTIQRRTPQERRQSPSAGASYPKRLSGLYGLNFTETRELR